MNTSIGWYNTVLKINTELESRTKSDHSQPLDLLLMEQTNTLIKLFNDCEFVGFPKTDPEAETIVSNVLANVQNSLSDKMDFVLENPFFNLYLGLCYLEKVLQLIKQEYESNLNTTLEHLENIIYNSNDYQNLVEVSRNIGRRIINKQQHPEFGKLKQHITEQLEYIERSNKIEKTLPPQQSTKEDLNENTEPNNLTISTIEDWLFEFKERNILTEPHYTNLVDALTYYFENGAFPKLKQTIKIGRVNKKLLGWHLNRIFHSEGKGVEIDLLSFAKASISTFKDVEFDEKDIQNSNLYKYFTTKTK